MATSGREGFGGAGSSRERRAGYFTRAFWFPALKVLLTLAAVALLLASLQDVAFSRVGALLAGLGGLAALVLLPQLVAFSVETWGWRRALVSAGHRVSFVSLLVVRVSSEALGQALPGGALVGETLKPALLARGCGLSFGAGVGATAHRKVLRIGAHGIYVVSAALIGMAALGSASRAWTGTSLLAPATIAIGCALLGGAFGASVLLGRGRFATSIYSLSLRLPSRRLRAGLRKKLSSFTESDRHSSALFSLGPRKTALPILACGLAWLCEALESWLILALLGAQLGFSSVLGVDMAVSLARQTLFLLPAGVGVQDAGYMSALSALGVPDAATLGAAFIALKRGKEVFWIAMGFAALLLIKRREPAANAESRPSDPVATPPSAAPHSVPG